jgi:hypothetical protein
MRDVGKFAVWSGVVLIFVLTAGVLMRTQVSHRARSHGGHSVSGSSRPGRANRADATERKVYAFSVVPGGVYSSDELARSRRLDSVVAKHYAGFGDSIRVHKTVRDMFMYMSYRKEDHVYWTRTKHKVPSGDYVLTDGKAFARARCGNRLSVTPQQPVMNAGEPGEDRMDVPEPPGEMYLADLKPPESEPFFSMLPSSSGELTSDLLTNVPQPAAWHSTQGATAFQGMPFLGGGGGGAGFPQTRGSAPATKTPTQPGGTSLFTAGPQQLLSTPMNFGTGPDPLLLDPASFASVPTPEPRGLDLLACGLGLLWWAERTRRIGT